MIVEDVIIGIDIESSMDIDDLQAHQICNHGHLVLGTYLAELEQKLNDVVCSREILSGDVVVAP